MSKETGVIHSYWVLIHSQETERRESEIQIGMPHPPRKTFMTQPRARGSQTMRTSDSCEITDQGNRHPAQCLGPMEHIMQGGLVGHKTELMILLTT